MATADSSDRPRRRFLPSIRNPLFNPDEAEIAGTQGPSNEDRGRSTTSGRHALQGIRNFFSSDRSFRTSSSDNGRRPSGTSLPSLSPQPPGVSTPQLKNDIEAKENASTDANQRTRVKDSAKKRQLISVEANLCVTGGSGGLPPGSSSSNYSSSHSSSPQSEVKEGVGTRKRRSDLIEKDSLNVDEGESAHILNVETGETSDVDKSRFGHERSLLSGSSIKKEEEPPVVMYTSAYELKKEFKNARVSRNYSNIVKFLTTVFNSFATMCKVFKADEYEKKCAINSAFVNCTYDVIMALPGDHRKAVLKSVINCLLSNIKKKQDDEDLAGYLILLQNPQFDSGSSYVIFSNLLRQVSSLSDKQHHTLVRWMQWLPISSFKAMVNRLKEFVSIALFPNDEDELPSGEKMRFWIPSAVKVLALLNAANWLNNKPIVSYSYMYIHALENINLTKEYETWQTRSGSFTFCQYPFLLTLSAKRYILQKDSESQMIEVARRSLLQGVKKRGTPAISMLFLNLRIRRDYLMADSLNEISRKREDLKKKLKVTFVGEPGVDMGGLTKEWFMLLIRKVFRPEYGMFRYDDKSSCYWFTNLAVDDLSEFNLVGALMGLAVYNSTILDIRFPLCCYKKLLSPAVVPANRNAMVGLTKLGLSDLKEVMPELARGLQELLSYEGNVEEDMCQTFQVSTTVCGSVITENLKPNGDTITVTNDNRDEYVDLYVDYILNKSIYRQFAAFYYGFHSVCASNALIMLRPEEVEMLVCGNPDFDMRALWKVTIYDGFSKKDATIRYFWETVGNFSSSLRRKLLRFCTGSDRIPVGGMAEMEFKITKMANVSDEMLPMAHTCFNQLCLPPYKTRQKLKTKLIIAISNSEGFGLE